MAERYPNHLISIPRSIVSLKHYFQVHDQPFTRSVIYLIILAVAVTALGVAVGLIGYFRQAPKDEAERAKLLTEKLSAVHFQEGKAKVDGKQPRILWEQFQSGPEPTKAPDKSPSTKDSASPKAIKTRTLLVVVDTTGKTDTVEKAAEAAGCAVSDRMVLFGPKAITTVNYKPEKSTRPEQGSVPYGDEAKLAELRKTVEAAGAKMPEVKIENDVATFGLEEGKVHVLSHTAAMMVLVNTTDKPMRAEQARWVAEREHPAMRPPEFLALITDTGVQLKAVYEKTARTWVFADQRDLSAATCAQWIASTAREVQMANIKTGMLPTIVQMLLFLCVELFFVALASSVAGLIVGGVMHAGLAYGEVLTIAIYAVTPARLVLPVLIAVTGLQADWLWVLPFIVGIVYTALGTHRTAQGLSEGGAPTL